MTANAQPLEILEDLLKRAKAKGAEAADCLIVRDISLNVAQRLGKRENETWPVPAEEAARMSAPVLGLFGGDDPGIPPADIAAFDRALGAAPHHIQTYPGAPHSFFDRTFNEHKAECDDAWRRVIAFMRSGDPAKTA